LNYINSHWLLTRRRKVSLVIIIMVGLAWLVLVVTVVSVLARPANSAPASTTTTDTDTETTATTHPLLTGQYDCDTGGNFQLCQNQWGIFAGVGNQTSQILAATGTEVTWTTTFGWQNDYNQVKTYTNVLFTPMRNGTQISAVTSIPTTWDWTLIDPSFDLRADISFDIWTGATPTGDPATAVSNYEIMIWLTDQGYAVPVGSLVAEPTIAGFVWELWSGNNGRWTVLSFKPSSKAPAKIESFNADVLDFFTYLVENQNVSDSQYIQAIQTGTEVFIGEGQLLSHFSLDVEV